MKKVLAGILSVLLVLSLAACGETPETESTQPVQTVTTQPQLTEGPVLEGHTLHIFCGAGMKKAFEEIVHAFSEETGCEVDVTYANAAQIQTQINTAQEGDFFIAGSQQELKPVEQMVVSATPLVRHIPVLAVQPGNPLGIHSVMDLAREDVRIVIGDPEATPVGKIAMKLFQDFGIQDQVHILSNTATAPAMSQALAAAECDVILVWKENVDPAAAEIVETPDLNSYVKLIPAARLTCSADAEAADAFLAFLESEAAQQIWVRFGYELAGK